MCLPRQELPPWQPKARPRFAESTQDVPASSKPSAGRSWFRDRAPFRPGLQPKIPSVTPPPQGADSASRLHRKLHVKVWMLRSHFSLEAQISRCPIPAQTPSQSAHPSRAARKKPTLPLFRFPIRGRTPCPAPAAIAFASSTALPLRLRAGSTPN